MNRMILPAAVVCSALIFSGCGEGAYAVNESSADTAAAHATVNILESPIYYPSEPEVSDTDEKKDEFPFTDEEVRLLAILTVAEAEDECETGKRLVIDTVLNRIDSEEFPDTVAGVIFQPGQFPSMTNGRADECETGEDVFELVYEEAEHRLDSDCIYFNSGGYCEWGKPLFRVQNHYFSAEKEENDNEE